MTTYEKVKYIYPAAKFGRHFKISNEVITYWDNSIGTQPTQAQLDAVTQANIDSATLTAKRGEATSIKDDTTVDGIKWRAIALILLDEINTLRALHGLSARTISQFKTAYANKISGGTAD